MAAVLPFGQPGDFMMDHPFWLVKVVRITKRFHTVQYFGGNFLGPYYPLHNGVEKSKNYVEKFQAGVLRFLHWDVRMVKPGKANIGKIHKEDLVVLSEHKEVKWTLPSRTAEVRASKPTRSAGIKTKAVDTIHCAWCGLRCTSEQERRTHQSTRSCTHPTEQGSVRTSNRLVEKKAEQPVIVASGAKRKATTAPGRLSKVAKTHAPASAESS